MRIPEQQLDRGASRLARSARFAPRWWRQPAVTVFLLAAGSHVAGFVPSPGSPSVTHARPRLPTSRAIGEPPRYGAPIAAASSGGAVYNLRVVSDASPDVTDLSSLVSSITAGWPTDREKVWALYYWNHILKRQTPPMLVHGFELADPVRNFADYGFTDCSTISGINQALYEVIGLRHQFWDICNHTVSQVEYDGSFHMIDSSLSNLVTSDDGSRLASIEEAAADDARLVRTRSLYASSAAGFLTGADGLRNLVGTMFTDGSTLTGLGDAFCAAGLKLRDYYYNWDAGHRYVLNLKNGESYTRYYQKLGDTSDYFVGSEPADAPDPTQQFDPEAGSNMGVRANGRWSFTPDLTAAGFTSALYSSSNLDAADGGGFTLLAAGQPGVGIYKVQGANVITSQFIHATFAKSDSQADARISVSRNQGRRWQLAGQLGSAIGGAVTLDIPLHDQVNGAYEVLVRIEMTAAAAAPRAVTMRALTIDTITQVNAKALPALNLGRNRIYIGEGDQTDTMVLWPELRGDRWQDDAYDSGNIASQPPTLPSIWTAVVYPARVDHDAYLTYRMDAPSDITRLVYGGRLHNYYPGSYVDYLHSFDGGATWIRSYRFDSVAAPWDVIHYETVTDVPPGMRTVLFKYLFHSTDDGGGRATGLFSARMEADHLPVNGAGAPLEVTWKWAEIQSDRTLIERSHKQRITSFPFTYDLNVGGADHPIMRSMRVNLEGAGDGTPSGYADGTDAGGVKAVHRWRTDGSNLARGRPYAISRPPSEFQESAGAANTTILTDGVVGGSVTGGLAFRWGACWDPGADLDIDVDLGGALTAGAFRGHIFGWPDWDALKGDVQDRVEVLTSVDGVGFQSQGLLQTSLWKKDVPINYMLRDDETATAWNFELLPGAPAQARYVRYHVTPARIMCISELQVLDRVTYTPFDIRLSPPGSGGSSATWPFTIAPVAAQPPVMANWPTPPDNATDLGSAPTLTWSAPGAAAYDVNFGRTSPPPAATIGQTVASYPTPPLENGTTYFWQVVARNANGATTGPVWSFTTAAAPPPPPPPSAPALPYGSTPAAIPGTIQAETFDTGGEGVAYHDATPGNTGGAFRQTDVDIEPVSGGGFDVGWIGAGEWLQYTVNVAAAGNYTVQFVVASSGPGGTFHLEANGIDVTGAMTVPDTGGWQNWRSISSTITLAAGPQPMRLVFDSAIGSGAVGNVDAIQVTAQTGGPPPPPPPSPTTAPYGGTPAAVPGTIQAEAFDSGSEGAAYHDATPGNTGGAFRQTDVDIEPASGGGYDVGWVAAGEWLQYTVNVAAAGSYTAQFTVASSGPGGTFHLEANGANVTGAMTIPDTGGWQNWQRISRTVTLAAGTQPLRLVFDTTDGSGAVGNVDAIQLTSATVTAPPPTAAFGGTTTQLPGRVEAENFDTGGEGAAYHDTTAGNTGGAYRSTDVDIESCIEGGYNVGWIAGGEWLTYTVNIATAGTYSVQLRVASPGGAALHVGFNASSNVSASVAVPATGGWQAWTTVTVPVRLAAGVQQLRLQFDTAGLNVNFIDVLAQ